MAGLLISVRNRERFLSTRWDLSSNGCFKKLLLLAVQHVFVFRKWYTGDLRIDFRLTRNF